MNPEDTYLIVIPGFDGRYEIFSSITERLKIKAVAVHLGPDMSNKSIPNLAADVRRVSTIFNLKGRCFIGAVR